MNTKKDFRFKCMDDCIHLKACRRVQLIAKNKGILIPRLCDEDCTAYQSRDAQTQYISIDEAISYARDGAQSIENGYSGYDVYCSFDLDGDTLGTIIDSIN